MSGLVDKSMQSLVKMISPDSMAFNEENNKQYTIKEFLDSEKLKENIQTGDIVLTKTSSNVYGMVRKMMDSEYDHVSVFLNKNQVLHISPPRIRIIPSNIFLMQRMQPFIIRPSFKNDMELFHFIESLKSFENKPYDYKGLIRIFGLKTLQNLFNISSNNSYLLYNLDQAKTRKRKICTDLIIFALARQSDKFMEALKKNISNLNFAFVGAFSPDDLKYLAMKEKNLFEIIYPTEKDIIKMNDERRKEKVNKINTKYSEYKSEVEIENQETQSLLFPNSHLFFRSKQSPNTLFSQIARLLALAQMNNIFSKGYLASLRKRLNNNQFIQNAKLVYNLWSLKNFMTRKGEIWNNKTKFIVTLYQVYKLLTIQDIIRVNFEKIYFPVLELILKNIYNYFQSSTPKL